MLGLCIDNHQCGVNSRLQWVKGNYLLSLLRFSPSLSLALLHHRCFWIHIVKPCFFFWSVFVYWSWFSSILGYYFCYVLSLNIYYYYHSSCCIKSIYISHVSFSLRLLDLLLLFVYFEKKKKDIRRHIWWIGLIGKHYFSMDWFIYLIHAWVAFLLPYLDCKFIYFLTHTSLPLYLCFSVCIL